jgi:hypothetical protein
MSSFFNQLSQIETTTADTEHNNPNATPTPVQVAAAEQLLQEQYHALRVSATSEGHQEFLDRLIDDIQLLVEVPPTEVEGVPQSYLDELDRVPKKALKATDTCPICGECFLDDRFPLVVQLPCHKTHRFDLECVGPWLRLQGTCPLDRKKLLKKKEVPKPTEDEEEHDYDEIYA